MLNLYFFSTTGINQGEIPTPLAFSTGIKGNKCPNVKPMLGPEMG